MKDLFLGKSVSNANRKGARLELGIRRADLCAGETEDAAAFDFPT